MSLRPLLEIAAENERLHALAGEVRAAAAGAPVEVGASGTLRPLLLATLLEDDRGLAERPALLVSADDRSARDLAADLRAYLAPRRVRFYPSRGTGYASHVTPPPHLVGLRIDALDALREGGDAVVVASATALAEAVPDASLRPAGFALVQGGELDLDAAVRDLAAAGYQRVEQVEERGQFAVRGGILDVYPATEERAVRIELFGDEIESMRWFSTFTQRSLGDAERVELAPAAELDAEHREMAELAAMEAAEEGKEAPSAADALPLEHFGAPLDLVPAEAAVILAAAEEIEPALRDHWEDATAAMHAEDARHLYVDVAAPLAARAVLSVGGAGERRRGRPSAPRAPSRRRAASRRPRASWRSWCAPATAPSSPSTPAARRSAPATASTGSTRASSKAAASRPIRGSPSPRRACARASSAPSCGSPSTPSAASSTAGARPRTASPAPAAAGSPSATCGSATTSSTRTTASPASPASRRARSAASAATTSTSNTRARTASTSPPSSWRS